MISRFTVSNFRCLKSVSVPLTPIHVIIGENDSGKTAFLQAFKCFADVAGGQNGDDPKNGLERDVNFEASNSTIAFSCETTETDATYSLELLVGKTWKVTQEAVSRHSKRLDLVNSRTPSQKAQLMSRPRLEDVPLDKSLKSFQCALRKAQLFKPRPSVMKLPTALVGQSAGMDEEGFGLPLLLDRISNSDPGAFSRIIQVFCETFPHFRRIWLETEPGYHRTNGTLGGQAIGKGIRFDLTNGKTIDAARVSDGVILFLAFLCIANQPDPPSILLIEEPECGIYPKLLRDVTGLMRDYVLKQPGSPQVVMTTHSPYILDLFQPDEVTFFSRARENASWVTARPLRDAPHIAERLAGGEFHLGELWFNLSEEEIFGDAAATT